MAFAQAVTRLSAIAYQSLRLGLRRPLIVQGFGLKEKYPQELWPDLDWANGHLTHIQFNEYHDPWSSLDEKTGIAGWFKGSDCRYNHLCLTNHDILVDKLMLHLTEGTPIDLNTGFKTELINSTWYEDQKFIDAELDPLAAEHYMKTIHNRKNPTPTWRFRLRTRFS